MKKAIIIIIAIMGITYPMIAINPKEDPFEFSHHRISLDGSITTSTSYIVEASYHYMFNYHIGIGAGLGICQSYFTDSYASGPNWQIDRDTSNPGNMYLNFSAIFKTPSILFKSVRWGLMARPSIALQVPYARIYVEDLNHLQVINRHKLSTNNGQFFFMDARVGIYANFEKIGISVGYLLTSFDINSYYRNFSYKGVSFAKFYPSKKLSHGIFLSAAYYL